MYVLHLSIGRRLRGLAGGLLVFMATGVTAVAVAQTPPDGGMKAFKAGNCAYCHGWSGNGKGDPFSPGLAANLRETTLSRDQIREVVQCGRPGTPMPHFDKYAYTDKRCFGQTQAEMGAATPDEAISTLTAGEVDAVADYVSGKLRNRGAITLAECEEFFGPGSVACQAYR